MQLLERKLLRVLIIIFTIILFLAIGYFVTGQNPMEPTPKDDKESEKESFNNRYELVDTKYSIPSKGVPPGYYQTDENQMSQLPFNIYAGPMPIYGIIPNGFFIVNIPNVGERMAKVPSGYVVDETDKTKIIARTQAARFAADADKISGTQGKSASFTSSSENARSFTPNQDQLTQSQYKINDFNVQYRDDISDMNSQVGIYDMSFSNMYVFDKEGNRIVLPFFSSQATPTYYTPGSFVFGSSGYVPNYEDSVYLSKSTGLSTLRSIEPTMSLNAGFCKHFKTSPLRMEQKCNSIDNATCSSTDCCVLFGGTKCVSGNEKGPYMKSVFSDPTVVNKDVYYFKGECYGNCQ